MLRNISWSLNRLPGLIVILLLAGCASNPSQTPNRYYSLSFTDSGQSAEQIRYPFLKVDLPNFSSKHHTEAIIYNNQRHELDRYSQSEWKEPLPVLLQEWLLQGLEYSNLFNGIMRATSRAKVPLFLESDIIKFQHNVKQQRVEISVRLTLLDYQSRKIIKHQIFNYQQKVKIHSAEGAVNAFNQILDRFYGDIYTWLAED